VLDWNKIKSKTNELYIDTTKQIKKYTPETFSKEKKFVNAIVISLVLMTMADKKADTEEVVASLELINEIDEIRDLEMTEEAIILYENHLESLSLVINNSTKWIITVAKLLSEIGKIKPYTEYPPMIETLLEYLAKAKKRVDPLEVDMKNKILGAIK
jgi:hypothetical protein